MFNQSRQINPTPKLRASCTSIGAAHISQVILKKKPKKNYTPSLYGNNSPPCHDPVQPSLSFSWLACGSSCSYVSPSILGEGREVVLITPNPIVMIPRQPALLVRILIILSDMVLVCGEDPGATLREVNLEDEEAGGVAWYVSQHQPPGDLGKLSKSFILFKMTGIGFKTKSRTLC